MSEMIRPVTAIAGDMPSGIEAAHRGHAQAVDRLRRLEGEMDQTFRQVHNARQELIERAGVNATVELSEALNCAWDRWLATEVAREMAMTAPTPESLDARHEDEALRIGNAAAERREAEQAAWRTE